MSALCQYRTFKRLLDMIDGVPLGKVAYSAKR